MLVLEEIQGGCALRIEPNDQRPLNLPASTMPCSRIQLALDAHGTRALVQSGDDAGEVAEVDLYLGIWSPLPVLPSAVRALGYDRSNRATVVTVDDAVYGFGDDGWTWVQPSPYGIENNVFDLQERRNGPYAAPWYWDGPPAPPCPLQCQHTWSPDPAVASRVSFGTAGGGSVFACARLRSDAPKEQYLHPLGEFMGMLEPPICFEGDLIDDSPLMNPSLAYKDGYLLLGERAGRQRLIHLATHAKVFNLAAGRAYLVNQIPPEAAREPKHYPMCKTFLRYAVVVTFDPPVEGGQVTYSFGLGEEAAAPCSDRFEAGTFLCGSSDGTYHLRASAPGRAEERRDIEVLKDSDGCHPITQRVVISLGPPRRDP
jgi:hypothetical protein